jgi:hypothetical protein
MRPRIRSATTLSALRSVTVLLLQVAAIALYFVGLVAPLTPSTGAPSLRDIFVFAVVPVAAMTLSLMLARHPAVRFVIICEVLIVAGFTTLLVWGHAQAA